jgi:hypothetical protein
MSHLQACGFCSKYVDGGCTIYTDTDWVDRRGGCGMFPHRDFPATTTSKRAGQQKQSRKRDDRKYHSKNDGRRKYKFNI